MTTDDSLLARLDQLASASVPFAPGEAEAMADEVNKEIDRRGGLQPWEVVASVAALASIGIMTPIQDQFTPLIALVGAVACVGYGAAARHFLLGEYQTLGMRRS